MGINKLTVQLLLAALLVAPAVAHGELFVSKGTSGELGYDYRQVRYDTGYSTSSNMLTGRVISDAYLWQPWFVTMGLSLAVTQDKSSSTSGSDTSGQFVSGEFNMAALPASSFPFSLRYGVSDSRIDSSNDNDNPLLSQSTARQFRRNNLQLSQGIHGKLHRVNLRYNNDEAKSDLGEHYLQEGYGIDYSMRLARQHLSANAILQTQSNNQNTNESDNTVVSLNHGYYPSSYANVDTIASHAKSDNFYTASLTGVTQQVTSNIDQASSTLGWQSRSRPLRVHAGIRVHQMDYLIDDGTTSSTVKNDGLNSSLGAIYQFTDRMNASVSGQYSELRSGSSEVHSHNEAAMVSYTSERMVINEFDYGWNSALSGMNQQSNDSKTQSTNLSLGHGASRSWMLESRQTVRVSLNQDLAEGYSNSSGLATGGYSGGMVGKTRRLGHSLSLGWQSNDQSGSSMAQLTASDSRGVIGDESTSQMVNAQLSRSQIVDNRSSLNGNLSWQAWRYTVPGTPDYGVGTTTGASGSYRYARPFTLQRVAFTSEVRLTDSQPAYGPSVQETFWDNRFTHEIGMMRSSLGLTYREHMDIQSIMLMFSVKRVF